MNIFGRKFLTFLHNDINEIYDSKLFKLVNNIIHIIPNTISWNLWKIMNSMVGSDIIQRIMSIPFFSHNMFYF